jgi:hypothetical protein
MYLLQATLPKPPAPSLLLSAAQQPKRRRCGKRGGRKSAAAPSHGLRPLAATSLSSASEALQSETTSPADAVAAPDRQRSCAALADSNAAGPAPDRVPSSPCARGDALFAETASTRVVLHPQSPVYYIFAGTGTSAGAGAGAGGQRQPPNVAAVPRDARISGSPAASGPVQLELGQ